MKIKGVIKNLLIKKKTKSDNSKIYLGISLELLRAVWSQSSSRQVLVPAYPFSQGLLVPSSVVGANYWVLVCCTHHFPGGSLCLSWLPLRASLFSV